jgi:hypothetical protein
VALPNILYLHSHDTGRYVQPYGVQVPTPNIQALADQGVLFRQAFCAAPTCSASRACLLTGQYGHANGMLGLAHRGWSLNDYSHHIVHTLHDVGYRSTLIGEQHISKEPGVIGYDEVMKIPTTKVESVAPLAIEVLKRDHDRPFFLSVGFFETHREFLGPGSLRDAHYSQGPANLPDHPDVRQDIAGFKASARSLDHGVGMVLNQLEASGLDEDTLVIFTTDHGMPFPGAKATLYDRGIGVMLILRGPRPFSGGRVNDQLVSHLDLFPTVCEFLELDRPVHPPVGRPPHARAAQHRRRAEQGPAAGPRLGRARDPAPAALRPALRPQRGAQPHRRPALCRRRGRPARAPGGLAARDRRPARVRRPRRSAAGRRDQHARPGVGDRPDGADRLTSDAGAADSPTVRRQPPRPVPHRRPPNRGGRTAATAGARLPPTWGISRR